MKKNYPIKYAVIPMIEQIGWDMGLNELERRYGPVYYIVSRCYLVEENKRYKADGNEELKYHVVCPYEYDEFNCWRRIEPSFNMMNGRCTNDIVVDSVYDSFEEAKEYKEIKNQKIFESKFTYMSLEMYDKKIKEVESEFKKTSTYYDELETMIENSIQDLNNDDLEKNKVIQLSRR